MWCPKCKSEYRDGYTVCSECGRPLVEVLPTEPELEPVYLTTTEGDEAWQLPELLSRAGITSFRHMGNGLFEPMVPEDAVPCDIYVDARYHDSARRCMSLLAGPPQRMEEDELLEAMEEYMQTEGVPEEPENPESGGAAWKVFLVLGLLLIGTFVYLLFAR